MIICHSVKELQSIIQEKSRKGFRLGFVPTMGALHHGHLTLVEKSVSKNDCTVVSVFVNPTQFNDKRDLEKYPRDLNKDADLLKTCGTDILFAPTAEEVYPHGTDHGADIDLGGLDKYMEGAFRPGHFNGMAQVVKRLLEIVQPTHLYMGQKDFQQFTIVQYMINRYQLNTKLIVCPIIREKNGLAMSSRNERLSLETRSKAGIIFETMRLIKRYKSNKSIEALQNYGMKRLKTDIFEPEYVSIVDGNKLTPLNDLKESNYAVLCVAVWADGIRLIDNLILKQ